MSKRLGVDYVTVSEDVSIIMQENSNSMLATKNLIEKDVDSLLRALETINQVEEETWKIYYGNVQVETIGPDTKDAEGNDVPGVSTVVNAIIPMDSKTKLDALEKIRQCNLDRAKLLKLLNPTQVNIEKMVYVEKMMPVLIRQVIDVAREFVPADKQLLFLEKMDTVNIEGVLDVK